MSSPVRLIRENLDLVDGRLQHELCVRGLHRQSVAFVDRIFEDPRWLCSHWLLLLLECSGKFEGFGSLIEFVDRVQYLVILGVVVGHVDHKIQKPEII